MTIEKNKVVSLSYTLEVEGDVIDKSSEEKPLVFLFGSGNLIPGFEKNIEGKQKGDEYSFTVAPEEGYGEVNDNAVIEVNKEIFVNEGNLINELKVDAVLPMQDQQGNRMDGRVVEIGLDKVKMDFNHPLAGKELNFSGQINEVREATEEELTHGHAHGPGAHQH